MTATITPGVPTTAVAALEGRSLSKRYGATQALKDVSIRLERGQVTALAGGNGAGKSTLIRLLTGMERPDEGELLRDGRQITLNSLHDATRAGIFCVFQDQPFVGNFEVYRQMFLGYEQHFRQAGLVSNRRMLKACSELLEELAITGISPTHQMGSLSAAAREVVALASVIAVSRLLDIEHPVILLDEPTASLSAEELDFLVSFIQSLKSRSAIVFVSHRVSEVLEWSDSLHVLRDGETADVMTTATAAPDRVYRAMGGQPPVAVDRPRTEAETATLPRRGETHERFEVLGAQIGQHNKPFDFAVSPGEIVGLAGVEGSGKEEFLRYAAGLSVASHLESTGIRVDGSTIQRHVKALLTAGVVYLSGERQRDGVFGRLTISENMAVSRRVAGGLRDLWIRRDDENARAERMVSRLAVKCDQVEAPLSSLSGGNQQKVLLGRCLETSPSVMLLDNVTRGVDVGARESIYGLFRELARAGMSLVLATDDLDELSTTTDRIVVFKGGRVVAEFDNSRHDTTPLSVLEAMV
ncbi:ribose transport system ATP-binding protein/erythritol transport system ATP-binding protein [Arthrobacter sp. SLBN-100]|uniref:sugar ABC transporter ATP-binding protein n=1 Tax=Arthrobacter sp. SLBN-100 TaxID=2768450 RepID=UPI001153D327|nr:sugar ABC transporter ATP-binding protein [Arthrobacter sp. SLBN-100]TQJ68422.1 ribose transport system ATP-binding protein/erythritol transport system ATP-binding protein [Arthrobacter sp. SLBN-100]